MYTARDPNIQEKSLKKYFINLHTDLQNCNGVPICDVVGCRKKALDSWMLCRIHKHWGVNRIPRSSKRFCLAILLSSAPHLLCSSHAIAGNSPIHVKSRRKRKKSRGNYFSNATVVNPPIFAQNRRKCKKRM